MMYLTNEARRSAIANIRKKIDIVMSMQSSEMSYIDAREIVSYLNQLIDQIEKERTDM